jgi:Ca2+-binding EF-hand superfamily protein
MLYVKHRGQSIKELRRLFKIYDLLDVKHRGYIIRKLRRLLKIYDKLVSTIEIKELKSSK